MRHVPKQKWMGCAVATAAMLADLSYEEVAASQLKMDIARTRWPKELCVLLQGVTETRWQLTTFWFHRPALAHFSFPQWPVAVFLQDRPFRPRVGQWIAVKREIVHDPGERMVHTVNGYPRRDWHIACFAQPVRPAEFAQNQARRRMDIIRRVLEMEGIG